jgi:hypothetical protein
LDSATSEADKRTPVESILGKLLASDIASMSSKFLRVTREEQGHQGIQDSK